MASGIAFVRVRRRSCAAAAIADAAQWRKPRPSLRRRRAGAKRCAQPRDQQCAGADRTGPPAQRHRRAGQARRPPKPTTRRVSDAGAAAASGCRAQSGATPSPALTDTPAAATGPTSLASRTTMPASFCDATGRYPHHGAWRQTARSISTATLRPATPIMCPMLVGLTLVDHRCGRGRSRSGRPGDGRRRWRSAEARTMSRSTRRRSSDRFQRH